MSGIQALCDTLKSAHQTQKTGKLFVYVKVSPTGSSSRPGEFDLRDGEILTIRHNQQVGRAALISLTARTIQRTLLMETASIPDNRDAETPSMVEALEMLETPLAADPPQAPEAGRNSEPTWANDLIYDAEQAMQQVYGANAQTMVEMIAVKYPPTHDPIVFLHHCQEKAALVLGNTMARGLFDPVFLKAQSTNLRR